MNYMQRIFASISALFLISETAGEQEIAERLEDEVASRARESAEVKPPTPATTEAAAEPAPAPAATQEEVAALTARIADLEARLVAVEQMAAASETAGEKTAPATQQQPWMNHPMNQKLRRV